MNTISTTEAPRLPLLPEQVQRPVKSFPWGKLVAILLSLLFLPLLLMFKDGQRGLLALCFAGILFFLLKRSPATGVAATLIYLTLVGGLRRWLIPVFDWSPTDTFLVVVPIAATVYMLMTRRNYSYTPIMRLLLVLLVMMAAEVVNPLQGGIAVGVAGMLFFIAPLLWYFVGRLVGSPTVIKKVIQAIIGISLGAALYGLYQTYFGFNIGEHMWIVKTFKAYQALNVGGKTRAFSFFTSAAEYAQFLGLGIVVLWAMFLRGSRLALLPIPLLAVALFLASIRYAFVTTVIACTVVWAIQGRAYRAWVPRGVIGLAVVVVALFFGLTRIHESNLSTQTEGFAEHTAQGLLHVGDQKYSTAGFHMGEVVNGVIIGFTSPIGRGLGVTTIASDKFGGDSSSSEFDISNMFISLGFVGGGIYIAVIIMALTAALRYWHRARTLSSLVIVGILVQLLGVWFNGGFYAASTLAWLCIGALERQRTGLRAKPADQKAEKALAGIS